jgi:hypothetical protein
MYFELNARSKRSRCPGAGRDRSGSGYADGLDSLIKLIINSGRIRGEASRSYGSVQIKVENDEARFI